MDDEFLAIYCSKMKICMRTWIRRLGDCWYAWGATLAWDCLGEQSSIHEQSSIDEQSSTDEQSSIDER